MNKWEKILILLTLLLLLGSCNNYSVENNTVKYNQNKFKILSSGLICVQNEDAIDSNYNYLNNDVDFTVNQTGNALIISTEKCTLVYKTGNQPIRDRITITFSKNTSIVTTPINSKDTQNLGGVIRSVDKFDGRLEYSEYNLASKTTPVNVPKGLLSQQGWTVLKIVNGKLVHGDIDKESNELFIFCYGNDYKQALKDFTSLNGKVPMLPKWTLGTWFSRYQPLSAQNYKDIVTRFRKEKIPIDVIVPDMNWHIDGWFGTRYDLEKFPDMQEFFDWTNEAGLHVGFNHHPGAVIYDDPRSREFCKLANMDFDSLWADSQKRYKESNWDFIERALHYGEGDSKDIEPFFNVFLKPIMDQGLDFHWVDGGPSTENLHEYYRLTEKYNNKRAIVLTRQVPGSFDQHRYPIGFSGDSYISWESLKFNTELTVQGANMGVYWSHDIGGHMQMDSEFDHSEMFARWVQSGAMSPFTRFHATGGTSWDPSKPHVRQPWKWGKTVLDASRDILQLKYKLLPYTYSLNRIAHDTGLIICHGIYMDYPEYSEAYKYANSQYMFGPSILVAPITEPAPREEGLKGKGYKNLWIPDGLWYDYFTGESIEGPVETLVSKPINEMPLYIKEGAILPMMDYMEYSDQKPLDHLTIEFYQPSKPMKNSFKLYEDDGKTLDYKNNQFRWTTINYLFSNKGSKIVITPVDGSYDDEVVNRNYTLIVKHVKTRPNSVTLNNNKINWIYKDNTVTFKTRRYSVNDKIRVEIK